MELKTRDRQDLDKKITGKTWSSLQAELMDMRAAKLSTHDSTSDIGPPESAAGFVSTGSYLWKRALRVEISSTVFGVMPSTHESTSDISPPDRGTSIIRSSPPP